MAPIVHKTLILLAAVLISACQKQFVPDDIPQCIQDKIKEIKAEPVRNPAGGVWQYEYNGKTVYYIPSYCCDISSELFDSSCTLLCSPDGGYTGKGDGKCPDFFTNRKNEKLIWQDDRK